MPFEMPRATLLIAVALWTGSVAAAHTQTFSANALLDVGGALASSGRSFVKGGLGKLEDGGSAPLLVAQALADLRAQLAPPLGIFTTVRLTPDQHVPFDVLEAYGRYQPVSTKAWLVSVKGGAFFAPISLENEGIGWTSP
jgi:hypothetical protein